MDGVNQIVEETLLQENLMVNDSNTIIERKQQRHEEEWRTVNKVGSLLGDSEDIVARKQLASAAMTNMEKIWIRGNRININKRIKLYNSLVKPILTYNAGTWGMTQAESDALNAFHRKQIRTVFKNSRLKNTQVYELSSSVPLSQEIRRARWQLFGHTLRMDITSPAQQAMRSYFANTKQKQFRGKPRTTIATTLNAEIKAAAAALNQEYTQVRPEYTQVGQEYTMMRIARFESFTDLLKLCEIAGDRDAWKSFSELIRDVAQVNRSIPPRNTSEDDNA